jgi:hypothetical protein
MSFRTFICKKSTEPNTFDKIKFIKSILVQDNGTPLCKGQFVNIDGIEYKINNIDEDINTYVEVAVKVDDVFNYVLIVIELKTKYDKDLYLGTQYITITSSNYFKGKYDLSDKKELRDLKFISIPYMTDETFFKTREFIPIDWSDCIPSRDK